MRLVYPLINYPLFYITKYLKCHVPFFKKFLFDFRCFLHVFIKRNDLANIHDHWLLDSPGTTED